MLRSHAVEVPNAEECIVLELYTRPPLTDSIKRDIRDLKRPIRCTFAGYFSFFALSELESDEKKFAEALERSFADNDPHVPYKDCVQQVLKDVRFKNIDTEREDIAQLISWLEDLDGCPFEPPRSTTRLLESQSFQPTTKNSFGR